MATNDGFQSAVAELTAALRRAGHRVWIATLSLAVATYQAFTQFCRWLGRLIARIYIATAEVLADIIYAAKVFYAPIASLIIYFCFHITVALYGALAYLAFIAIAIALFYKRSDKTEKLQRPLWATALGHAIVISILLTSGLLSLNRFVPLRQLQLVYLEATAGNPTAMYTLALDYGNGDNGFPKDPNKAAEWYEKAADQGDAKAMNNLGVLYATGAIGQEANWPKAFEWYERSAEAGNPTAMSNLAHCYALGEGAQRDESQAFDWYQKAANAGNLGAMNAVGTYYEDGVAGLPKNDAVALVWYQRAAAEGETDAMVNLGRFYYLGRGGLQPDKTEALTWLQKSADAGNSSAKKLLQTLQDNGHR